MSSSGAEVRVLQSGKGGTRMVRDDGVVTAFELPEPSWAADKGVTKCTSCGQGFSWSIRKHHCRRSGIVICDKCCCKIPLERLGYMDPVRVSLWWKEHAQFENEFFRKNRPVLRKGAVFTVEKDGNEIGDVFVGTTDTGEVLVFTKNHEKQGANGTEVLPGLPVRTIHLLEDKDKGFMTISTKSHGRVVFKTQDKDLAKRWRKSIKHMVKLLHGTPKLTIPAGTTHKLHPPPLVQAKPAASGEPKASDADRMMSEDSAPSVELVAMDD